MAICRGGSGVPSYPRCKGAALLRKGPSLPQTGSYFIYYPIRGRGFASICPHYLCGVLPTRHQSVSQALPPQSAQPCGKFTGASTLLSICFSWLIRPTYQNRRCQQSKLYINLVLYCHVSEQIFIGAPHLSAPSILLVKVVG